MCQRLETPRVTGFFLACRLTRQSLRFRLLYCG